VVATMINGIQALKQLDKGLQSVKNDIDRIDLELTRLSNGLHNNRVQQGRALKHIAKVRLDALASGELIESLDSADRHALDLFQQRKGALESLEQKISAINERLFEQERIRDNKQSEVEQLAQKVVDCEHGIQSLLENDDAYQAQLELVRVKESIALNAEEKAEQAEIDRKQKGTDYEKNKLFMYLWKRGYGTSAYKANPLIRFLDGWVDGLCAYSKYRATYWTLLEIPNRMLSHAETAQHVAEEEAETLVKLEQSMAQQRDLPKLQAELDGGEDELSAIDGSIEALEEELNAALGERADFANAKDSLSEKSLETLSTALERQSLLRLSDAVHQTRSSDDNLLVRELGELREQCEDLEEELKDHRQLHDAKLQRLKELESVRRRFKSNRYDDLRSGFGNGDIITSMLNQFINGMVNSRDLWRAIERNQRHRDVGAWPDFGSGGVFRPNTRKHRSPWHTPGRHVGGRPGGGFRLPKTGGFSSRGGAFKTGGGF